MAIICARPLFNMGRSASRPAGYAIIWTASNIRQVGIKLKLYLSSRRLAKNLRESGLTLALAESCTGGLLAHTLTNIPGSSAYFKGGLVAYRPEVKISPLGVDPSLIEHPGVVSAPVAKAMAAAARRLFLADLGIGITGVAGPGGGTPETPVGLVYVAIDSKHFRDCRRFNFTGSRAEIKRRAVQAALSALRRALRGR